MVLQVWGCSAGCRDALGTSNKLISTWRGTRVPSEELPGQCLTSTQNLTGGTYREKKNFGKRDSIALGLCEENNQHFITA